MTPHARARIAAIGECMIELRHAGSHRLELSFGGDTFNTAVYLARLGRGDYDVDYATALGDDPYSAAMRASLAAETIGLDLTVTRPGRLPGLYAIRTDERGERSFFYWRGESAARTVFDGAEGERLARALAGYGWLYLSAITLSILDAPARARLVRAVDAARACGARVAFDTNWRPRGWPDAAAARACIEDFLRRTDVALPTFSDERALFGDSAPAATLARLAALGIREVAIKDGAGPALVALDGRATSVPALPVANVVDTTAAGDAFNSAYLAARLRGAAPEAAAADGHRLAAAVIAHRGAIIPAEAMPP